MLFRSTDKENLDKAIYGLPEFYREQIKQADLIANPGCYPTTALLALFPIISTHTKLIESIDFPIYFNNTTQLPNSASNWESINFDINLDNPLRLNTGGILELPIKSNSNLVSNSFKVGDTIQLNDFIVGTNSLLNFSGQYEVDSVGVTNSYIYLDVNNNQSLINYGSSSSNVNNGGLPLDFNNTDGSYPYILSNSPYLGLNKGYKYRITRVSESEESEITERYLIERIK